MHVNILDIFNEVYLLTLDTGLSIALNTTVVILFFHSLDKLRCSTRGLARNASLLVKVIFAHRLLGS